MSKQHVKGHSRVVKGAADRAKEAVRQEKMAKGSSSQVVRRAAGSGGVRETREDKRQ